MISFNRGVLIFLDFVVHLIQEPNDHCILQKPRKLVSMNKNTFTVINISKSLHFSIGIVCPQHSIAKGQVVGTNTSYGKSISYRCNSGYILVNGDATRACSSCGNWTGKMPTCAGIY